MIERQTANHINLSAISRKLLNILVKQLNKQANSSLNQIWLQASRHTFIDKNLLTFIFSNCQQHVSSLQVEKFYNQLIGDKLGLLQVKVLKQHIAHTSRIHEVDAQNNAQLKEIKRLILSSGNIFQIITTIAQKNGDILTKSNIYEILNKIKYNNVEKKKRIVELLLNNSQGILINDFFQKIGLNFRERFSIRKLQQKVKKEKTQFYFNPQSKWDHQFQQTAKKYIQGDQIFKDEKTPTFKQSKNIHLYSPHEYNVFYQEQEKAMIYQNRKYLIKFIKTNDIVQGQVENCYFLSAMAALAATQPSLIYRLFCVLKNPSHLYGIRLFIDGKWKIITVDTQFPINQQRDYCCARPLNSKIWPLLLQKAFAKVSGSYDYTSFGTNQQGIQILSGAPSTNFMPAQEAFQFSVQGQLLKGSVLTCNGEFSQHLSNINGLKHDHSYSIIGVFQNNKGSNGEVVTLFKIRNPWGHGVWKGRWDIKSDLWTEQLRQKLNYKVDPWDGSFFMCKEDFTECFKQVNVCKINIQNKNSWLDLKSQKGQFTTVLITIKKTGFYYFTTYLQNRRIYKKMRPSYQRWSWMFLMKMKGEELQQVCCNCCFLRNNSIEMQKQLLEGNYFLICRMDWDYPERQQYCLSCYGPQQVLMKQIQYKEQLLHQYIEREYNHVSQSRIQPNRNWFKKIEFYPLLGYGFIEIENRGNDILQIQIIVPQQKDVLVLGTHSFPLRLTILPEIKASYQFIIKPNFDKSQIQLKSTSFNSIIMY